MSPGIRPLIAALFVCTSAAAGAAGSNPRQVKLLDYVIPQPVTETAAIGEWLMRLAGRYRIEGLVDGLPAESGMSGGDSEPSAEQPWGVAVKGSGDCAPVGTGPGMQCILGISWIDRFEVIMDEDTGPPGVYNLPGGASYLSPSMMLAGLEPAEAGIAFLLVDNKGLPEGGSGAVAGDRATLRAPCVNAPALFLAMNPDRRYTGRRPDTCERITRIDAKAGSSVVHLTISIEINGDLATQTVMTLRREQPGRAERKR